MTTAHDSDLHQPASTNGDVNSSQTLQLALDATEELKAESIKILDIAAMTTIAEHMLICTGRSARHVKSIGENLVLRAKQSGMAPRVEGLEQAEWVLIDLNGVIVHIFQPTARAYYQIEKLWDVDPGALDSTVTPPSHDSRH